MGKIDPIRKYGISPYFGAFIEHFQRHKRRFAVVRKFRATGAICILLAGCATPVPTENPRQVWCDHNQPRRDATAETPRAELDQINSHNAKGARWCGWKP